MSDGAVIHPLQGRMFSSPAQLAAEGAADAFRDAVAARIDALATSGADWLELALLGAAATALELELRSPRPRPSAIMGGIRLLRDLMLDAAPVAPPPGGVDDDEWLADLTRAAALRDTPHP